MARRQAGARSNQDAVRYVALLRGINVGRAKRIAMGDLRAVVERLGFTEVRTLLNSGNVVFTGATAKPQEIATRIEEALASRLGVSSATIVLTGDDVQTIVDDRPNWKSATGFASNRSPPAATRPARARLPETMRPPTTSRASW